MTEQVLFVCHANLCRSPMAEYLAAKAWRRWPVRVASAGTDAVADLPIHPYAAVATASRGIDASRFRSRRLRPELLAEATLVLTATRRQRTICAGLAPTAVHRTFTLHQFARLAAVADPPRRLADGPVRAAVEAAARARSRLQPMPDAEDLADPIGGTAADFHRCAEEIERSVAPIGMLIAAAG